MQKKGLLKVIICLLNYLYQKGQIARFINFKYGFNFKTAAYKKILAFIPWPSSE
jgi:hypothetical protein